MSSRPVRSDRGPAARPRSFRLSEETLTRLDERAREIGESANGLAQRLLDEALRTDRHPAIYFRPGGSGARRPALAGTRLDVWQVIETLRAEDGDIAATAGYLGLAERQVRASVSYCADFPQEIDAFAAAEREAGERERAHEERERAILG